MRGRGAVALDEPARCARCSYARTTDQSSSAIIQEWNVDAGITIVLNDPAKPWRNDIDENFNGKLRDECLSVEWFRSRRR